MLYTKNQQRVLKHALKKDFIYKDCIIEEGQIVRFTRTLIFIFPLDTENIHKGQFFALPCNILIQFIDKISKIVYDDGFLILKSVDNSSLYQWEPRSPAISSEIAIRSNLANREIYKNYLNGKIDFIDLSKNQVNDLFKYSFFLSQDTEMSQMVVYWNDDNRIRATNGHILCRIKSEIKAKMYIPLSPFLSVRDRCAYYQEGKQIIINYEDILMIGTYSVSEKDYPSWDKAIPVETSLELIINRKDLAEILNTIPRKKISNPMITIEWKEQRITCRREYQEWNMPIKIEFSGELTEKKCDISFNQDYLISMIALMTEERIILKTNTRLSACIIIPDERHTIVPQNKQFFIIMPLKNLENRD